MGRVADEAFFRGRSSAESDVIHAVWKEIGGELVEEFVVPTIPGQLSRARHIDGVFAVDGPRRWHPAHTPLALRGRDIAVCQAKAGQLDLGVLGQTLFAAELIQREHAPRSMRLIAAAVQPNPRSSTCWSRTGPSGGISSTAPTRISNRGDQARRSCAKRWSRCSTVRPAGC